MPLGNQPCPPCLGRHAYAARSLRATDVTHAAHGHELLDFSYKPSGDRTLFHGGDAGLRWPPEAQASRPAGRQASRPWPLFPPVGILTNDVLARPDGRQAGAAGAGRAGRGPRGQRPLSAKLRADPGYPGVRAPGRHCPHCPGSASTSCTTATSSPASSRTASTLCFQDPHAAVGRPLGVKPANCSATAWEIAGCAPDHRAVECRNGRHVADVLSARTARRQSHHAPHCLGERRRRGNRVVARPATPRHVLR